MTLDQFIAYYQGLIDKQTAFLQALKDANVAAIAMDDVHAKMMAALNQTPAPASAPATTGLPGDPRTS